MKTEPEIYLLIYHVTQSLSLKCPRVSSAWRHVSTDQLLPTGDGLMLTSSIQLKLRGQQVVSSVPQVVRRHVSFSQPLMYHTVMIPNI